MKKKLETTMKVERAKLNMSQERLGAAVGVSKQYIMLIETGKANPSLVLALNISGFFNVSVHELFKLVDYGK